MTLKLRCRMGDCSTEELFDGAEQINQSDWTEITRVGAAETDNGERIYVHQGFCPGHSL